MNNTAKLTARVDELETLVRRLMSLLVRHASVHEGKELCNLWDDYQQVVPQINQDFLN